MVQSGRSTSSRGRGKRISVLKSSKTTDDGEEVWSLLRDEIPERRATVTSGGKSMTRSLSEESER